jgi:hypothetical protein
VFLFDEGLRWWKIKESGFERLREAMNDGVGGVFQFLLL